MKKECGYNSCSVGKKRSRSRRSKSIMDEDNGGGWKQGKRWEAPSPCSECGKKFWSWKALFGHMRCHPERNWRGIIPPPNARRQQVFMNHQDHEVATCLLLLANGNNKDKEKEKEKEKEEDVHQCSSCNKVLGSHQALGGHRASHKNVKGCEFENIGSTSTSHKCSICLRVFSTGQALGGHKRCHWEKGVVDNINTLLIDSSTKSCVDLNFPPPPHPPIDPLTLDLRLAL